MGLNSEPVAWGKLNPRLAWELFKDLQSKGDLTLADCDQCKKTLENARSNILDAMIDDNDDDNIQVIENQLSEIEMVKLGFKSQEKVKASKEKMFTPLYSWRCGKFYQRSDSIQQFYIDFEQEKGKDTSKYVIYVYVGEGNKYYLYDPRTTFWNTKEKANEVLESFMKN